MKVNETSISFAGQVALISGASRGIGRETAQLLAYLGASVIINYRRNRRAAESVLSEIRRANGKAEIFQADCSDFRQCEQIVDFTMKRFKKIDVLVNNAGIWGEAVIHKMTPAQLQETWAVNVNSYFYLTRLVVPGMMKKRKGSIVNISSTAGQRGEAFHSHYAATKGALISFTKSLATELAPYNIRVNSVAPGWVETDMSRSALKGPERKKILRLIPLARAAHPSELATCIVFLASDWASFVTGEIFNVNGGAVLVG